MSRVAAIVAVSMCAVAAEAAAWTPAEQQPAGAIAGVVADETGAPLAGAAVTLTTDTGSRIEIVTGADGRFSLTNIRPGSFALTVSAHGFAERTLSGTVAAGVVANVGEIRLRLAVHAVSIDVMPTAEIAERQIKEQEQQRLFGVVPNFYLSFAPDAAPLNPRQKFQLSWKTRTDPAQFAFVGIVAAIQQARNDYSGFGDGVPGYAKRYAALYASAWTSSLMTRVLLPSLLRQDPRYFYKGTGSTKSRLVYAVSRSVIRKGDNGRWQPNYSGILGSLASGAIANLYYPREDRRGGRLTLQHTALGIAGSAIGHVSQEFLYARFTSRSHPRPSP